MIEAMMTIYQKDHSLLIVFFLIVGSRTVVVIVVGTVCSSVDQGTADRVTGDEQPNVSPEGRYFCVYLAKEATARST